MLCLCHLDSQFSQALLHGCAEVFSQSRQAILQEKPVACQGCLVLSHWYDHFTISLPLIITEDQVDRGVEILDEVLKIADDEAEE